MQSREFEYTHQNIYHHKLAEFGNFVYRDRDGEMFRGRWSDLFNNGAEINLEIGAGFGHFLRAFLSLFPAQNLVAIEYRFKRLYNLARKIDNFAHLRLLRANALRIDYFFAERELKDIFCFFPDPWPKLAHHKKRLLQVDFFQRIYPLFYGRFFIKTDDLDYFKLMQDAALESGLLVDFASNCLQAEQDVDPLLAIKSKFEKLFMAQNKRINALILRKGL